MKLPNLTFNEYFVLEDKREFDFAIRYDRRYFNKPIDIFNVGPFIEMSFKTVKDMQYNIDHGLKWEHIFNLVETIKGIDQKTLGNKPLIELCQFKSYVVEQIYGINKVEAIALSYKSSSDEEAAGIDDLAELGSYLQLSDLTGGDVTKNKLVNDTNYSECLLELVKRKRVYDYNKERQRQLKSHNNK